MDPSFFPGFGSGVRMPILSSSGGFPSFAVKFSMCYIFVNRRGRIFYMFCMYVVNPTAFTILHSFGSFVYFISSERCYHGTWSIGVNSVC